MKKRKTPKYKKYQHFTIFSEDSQAAYYTNSLDQLPDARQEQHRILEIVKIKANQQLHEGLKQISYGLPITIFCNCQKFNCFLKNQKKHLKLKCNNGFLEVFIDRKANKRISITLVEVVLQVFYKKAHYNQQIKLKMPSILESINMFQYEQFWRFKGDRQITHKCGGLLTILVFIILGGITGYQVYLISQRSTIRVVTQNQIDFSPDFINITTNQNDPKTEPYMAAIVVAGLSSGATFSPSDYKLSAYQSTHSFDLNSSSYKYNYSQIVMQSCTPQHFSKLPNVFEKFESWGMSKWLCFPINRTFEIGGNILSVKKYLQLTLQCRKLKCNQANSSNLIVSLMTLNTFVNPTNNTQPFMAYFNRREAIFQPSTSSRNFIYLDQTILKTDNSLTPFPQYSTRSSFEEGSLINSNSYSSDQPTSTFYILLSGKTIKQTRSYLKILTALSFIGGLFAPIVGVFSLLFMMSKFGTLVYELRFAQGLFRNKLGYHFHYLSFISQFFSGVFGKLINCEQDKYVKQRQQLVKTVSNLLDVVYLQKRISFLQRCMTIVLQKHQLKALYMLHSISREEADQNYQSYNMRSRLFKFLAKHKQRQIQSKKEHQIKVRGQMMNQVLKEACETKQQTAENLKKQTGENLESRDVIRSQQKYQTNAASDLKKLDLRLVKLHSQSQNIPFDVQQDRKLDLGQIDVSDEDWTESNSIGDQEESIQMLAGLSQLYQQAHERVGNERSKRIYSLLDKKIQRVVERVREYQGFKK